MKKILLIIFLMTPLLTFASDDSNGQEKHQKFEAKKQKILQMLEEKQACVEKATSKKELKKCKVKKK